MSDFRISHWPGEPIEPRPVAIWETELIEHEGVAFLYYGETTAERPPLHELYLRGLLEVDLDSSEELSGFVAEHGRLDVDLFDPRSRWPFLNAYEVSRFDPPDPEGEDLWSLLGKASYVAGDHLNLNHGFLVPLDVTRRYLKTARALSRHWIAHSAKGDLEAAWEQEGFSRPKSVDDAWRRFTDLLNPGLEPFHVRVGVRGGAPEAPNLFTALCLQIANHVAERATVKQCANEKCGRFFFRQEGRAVHGHYKTEGVLFCSKSCARAQAQRRYQRKKRRQS